MFRIVTPSKDRPFTIGRKEGSDLHFPEKFVSREHAIIERTETATGPAWRIRSLTENSFTLVNDEQVSEFELHDGDIIGIGVREDLIDFKGRIMMEKAGLTAYCHGVYYGLSDALGFFGYTVAAPEVLERRMRDLK